jgi:hypothetical protein
MISARIPDSLSSVLVPCWSRFGHLARYVCKSAACARRFLPLLATCFIHGSFGQFRDIDEATGAGPIAIQISALLKKEGVVQLPE